MTHTNLHHTIHMFSTRQLKTQRPRYILRQVIMPYTTRAEWVAKLEKAGTTVPKHWTSLGRDPRPDGPHTTGAPISAVDKVASKKKVEISQYVQNLGGQIRGNMTIAQLYGLGEQITTEHFPPTEKEIVGFGRHGHMAYGEEAETVPGYTWHG